MSCDRYADAILEHALGEPAPPELDRHLLACAGCREGLEQERRLLGRIELALREAVAVTPGPELLPRVRERVASEASASRGWAWPWLMPVAVGLAAVLAVLFLRQPAPTGSPANEVLRAPSPAVAESPRPVPEARVAAVEPPLRPPLRKPRPQRLEAQPEVFVPPGEEELVRRFVVALRARRADETGVLAGEIQPGSPELKIPLLEAIPLLEMKPLTSGTDPKEPNDE